MFLPYPMPTWQSRQYRPRVLSVTEYSRLTFYQFWWFSKVWKYIFQSLAQLTIIFLSLRNIIHSSELLHISKLSQNILTRRSIYLQSDDAVGQHLARVLDDVNCRMIGGAIGGNFSRIKLIGNHLSRNTSTVSLKVNQQNGKWDIPIEPGLNSARCK